jgi:hypothetical protein
MINSWAAKKAHFRIELACKCSTFENGREQNSQTSSRGVARDGLAMAWTLKLRISLAMCLQSGTTDSADWNGRCGGMLRGTHCGAARI